jgi:hypothetical protein
MITDIDLRCSRDIKFQKKKQALLLSIFQINFFFKDGKRNLARPELCVSCLNSVLSVCQNTVLNYKRTQECGNTFYLTQQDTGFALKLYITIHMY